MIYWKPVWEGGAWFIVSSIYEPARKDFVGSGIFNCTPYQTRALARSAIKQMFLTKH